MITITATNCKKDGYGVMDGTTEYVDTEPGIRQRKAVPGQ